jgi:hypothetical protein
MSITIMNKIRELRPNLSDKSVNTYTSILWNMYKKVYDDGDIDFNKFNDKELFLKYLEKYEPQRRKTYLTALTVITGDKDYRDLMIQDAKACNDELLKNKKNKKQEDNWLTSEDIDNVIEKYKIIFDELIAKLPTELTNKEFQNMQTYIILCLTTGKYFPPRRSMDWTEFKIKNFELETDNYMIKNKNCYKMYFNVYKTKKIYGTQNLVICDELKDILDKWYNIIETKYPDCDYLLTDRNQNKLDSSKLNQRFEAIFGKKASVNILRHSYVSSKYENIPDLEELKNDSIGMGHNLGTHLVYYKK